MTHSAGFIAQEYGRATPVDGGNQVGRPCGAAELAIHLTGRYPDWWDGRRFDVGVAWRLGCHEAAATMQSRLLGGMRDKPGCCQPMIQRLVRRGQGWLIVRANGSSPAKWVIQF